MRLSIGRRVWNRARPAVWLPLLAVFLLVLFSPVQAGAESLTARGFKMAGDATRMRLVVQFNAEPNPRWFLLRAPARLVVDLPDTKLAFNPKDMRPLGLIKSLSYGMVENGGARLILATKGSFLIDSADVRPNEDGEGYRMVFELSAASDREFEAALAEQAETTASTRSTEKGDRVVQQPVPAGTRPFTLVIDPGHGGIDGGAKGVNGAVEKDVTLAFALELREKLQASGRFKVVMTRETDEFLRLDDRVRIARQNEADLLISIHADTISVKGIRGATVYTVSDKASDADSQALADRENLSDALAGVDTGEANHEVADILVDLIRRETHGFSMRFAKALVDELGRSVGLIKNPHRYAGFKVLKAPDVPSVLVELGYLSNPDDEAQLLDPKWRLKATESISNAISQFAAAKAAGG